jgi:GGDEF domain-containing protein
LARAGGVVAAVAGISFSWEGALYCIGASVGVAIVTRNTPNPARLLAEADAACYAAKDQGRNRVAISQASDNAEPAAQADRKPVTAT